MTGTGHQRGKRTRMTGQGSFGSILRHFRMAAELTQEGLAERAGLSIRAISDIERGVSQAPYQATIHRLCQALALSPDDGSALLQASRRRAPVAESAPRRRLLPLPATPLIGREREVVEIGALLDRARLVTVTGPGGVGKTRLALEIAAQIQPCPTDAVFFVSLAPLRDPLLVAPTIARIVGVREVPDRVVMESLVVYLRDESVILVLDNFEHLLDATDQVANLLASCPGLRVLATSRAPLHLQGEHEYPLSPLDTPDPLYAPPAQALLQYPAIQLFAQRAGAVRPDFHLDDTNAEAVAAICHRLDGLPLAIELAATRTKFFPPHALLARLDRRFQILTGGPRDLPIRLQTMRDAIAWSYDLLDPAEQTLFRRLAVFSGGCTLEAAEAVCRGAGELGVDTLEGLISLVDKSLLMVRETPGEKDSLRFFMLETLREFALERLRVGSEAEAEDAYREHARYFLGLATRAEQVLSGSEQSVWLERLEREHDNLRSTLQRAQCTENIGLGLELVGRLWPFWLARNHYDEAQKWLDAFLPRVDAAEVAPAIQARARYAFGALGCLRGDNEASISLRHALHLARWAGEDAVAAETLRLLGLTEQTMGHYAVAEELFGEGLEMHQRLGNQAGVGSVLSALAGIARYQGDFTRAVSLYQEALALGRAAGDSGRVADSLARLGSLETERGRPEASHPYYEEARALHHELGDTFGIGDILLRSGETAADMGDYAGAMIRYEKAMELFDGLGSPYSLNYLLLYQAEAALALGDHDRAEALTVRCLAFFRTIADRRSIANALFQLAEVAWARERAGEAVAGYQERLALSRELNTRPEIARCLERMALVTASQGQEEGAALLLGAASALRAAMGSDMAPADRPGYDRCLAMLRDQLGSEVFTARKDEGRSMSLERAVAYALEEVRV